MGAQPEVDTDTQAGRTLQRTLDVLALEKFRPRSTLGLVYDAATKNQALIALGRVFVEKLEVVGDGIPVDSIRFTYSDGVTALYSYVNNAYLDQKRVEHQANLDALPDSELRT